MTLKYIYAKMPISVALSSGLRKMFRPRDVCNKVILGFFFGFFFLHSFVLDPRDIYSFDISYSKSFSKSTQMVTKSVIMQARSNYQYLYKIGYAF